jgi:hypothetical protein
LFIILDQGKGGEGGDVVGATNDDDLPPPTIWYAQPAAQEQQIGSADVSRIIIR